MKTKIKLLQDDLYNYVSKFNRASKLTAVAFHGEKPTEGSDRASPGFGSSRAEPLFPLIPQPLLTSTMIFIKQYWEES